MLVLHMKGSPLLQQTSVSFCSHITVTNMDITDTIHSNEIFNVQYVKCRFDNLFHTSGLPDTLYFLINTIDSIIPAIPGISSDLARVQQLTSNHIWCGAPSMM